MKNIKSILSIILVIGGFAGCSDSVKDGVKDGIINKVDQGCGSKVKTACTIVLKEITKFKWDKLYFFGSWTTSDSITRVIGFNYEDNDDVPDDNTRMLFTDGGKVVYTEDFTSVGYNSTIDFGFDIDSLLKKKTPYIIPSRAIFKVEKYKTEYSCKTCFGYRLTTDVKSDNAKAR